MTIAVTRIDPAGADRDELFEFFTTTSFPFHVGISLSRAEVEEAVAGGRYRSDDNDSYWIDDSERGRIGFFRFEELSEDVPLFDLRLGDLHRGLGLGVDVLRAATDLLFGSLSDAARFEGQTRDDNIAMRRTFERAGWVQEAYYREGWPVTGGPARASVAYSMLRRDWESGETTPIVWDIP